MMFDSRRQDLFSLCELTSEVFLSLGWGVVSRGNPGGIGRGCIFGTTQFGECRDGSTIS